MGGAAEYPQRSSSPLKRRASSMEPTEHPDATEDVDMITVPSVEQVEDVETGREGHEQSSGSSKEGQPSQPAPTGGSPDDLPLKSEAPPLSQQIKTIETLLKAFNETPVQEGDTAYVVSRAWLTRAQALGGGKAAKQDPSEGSLGPIDNSDIIAGIVKDINDQDVVRLKPGTTLENFELFSKDAWDLVVDWHGLAKGQLPIVRTAQNTTPGSDLPNYQFELHPPVLTVHRLWSENSPIPIEQGLKARRPSPIVVMSSTTTVFNTFLKQIKQRSGISLDRKVRLWRIPQKLPASAPSGQADQPSILTTPPDSPGKEPDADGSNNPQGSWPHLLLDVVSFVKLERDVDRELVNDAKDNTNNPNYNGNMTLSLLGLTVDQSIVLDENIDKDAYVSNFTGKGLNNHKGLTARGSSSSLNAQGRNTASGRSSPAPSGPITRGRAQQKSGRTIGCVGLSNLGNTCYMNSALQSLRSVEELTKYFLTHEAEKEINTDNPLAHNGDVARAYGHLLAEMYKDPAPPSIVPKFFRSTIGRYAPAFAGYGQQDSQEFLGFLLDGLQEDLSRIKKKPYIEKPDSTDDMINNLEAIREMAAKVWDITKKRDDSVVADLFTGMYKSTLVCPVCQKISITFDPFNNLTLPLPVQNTWSKTVKYYPLNDTPVEMAVELDKNSSIKSLKDFISARVGVPTERLFAAEEFRDKFFKIYQDFSTVSEQIGSSDLPTVHELEAAPTNTNPTKKTKKVRSMLSLDDEEDETPSWDNPMAERMVVPVLHRFNPNTSSGFRRRGGNNQSAVSPPHFIVLTPEEARDEDAIRRKVLEKVATFTNWPEFNRAEDSDTSENTDPEMSVTNASDIDSSGDGKVVAKSVEGEDDMVDVTMKDAHDNRQPTVQSNTTASASSPLPLKVFNSQRPKWVNPSEFLDASFQNLFELSFFHEQGSLIPSGWSGVQDGSLLPKLESRKPAPSTPTDQDMASPATWGNGTASEEDSSVEEASHTSATTVTRMNDESSEEDVEFPPFQDIPVRSGPAPRPRGKGGKKMKPRQLNHKGGRRKAKQMAKQNARQQQHHSYQASEPQDITPDDGPLVRLGEGIVVEWDESTWDTVYGRNPRDEDDTMRGMALFNNLETLHDPLLEAKKKERIQRKKTGISLNDCLDEFEKEEILSEQDMWYCPRCKEHRRASKKFDLWKTPDILIVHLKRFSSSGWRRDKLEILVDFPIEGLDLTKRVIDKESGKEEIYDLIAVDNHWGGLGGGHYTAFAKSFVDSEWYEYNDSSVSKQKDPTRVVTNGAYLLFYRRRSDAPLGGPRFQEIVDRYDNNSATDEEMSESGEGQRLGTGSSLRGSSSALTGAEVVLHKGDRGLVSRSTSQPSGALGADQPPSYQDVASAEDEEEEEENGILGMTNWDASDDKVHNSIEDEGIAMADWNATNWNFDSLSRPRMGSEAEAENGYASDDAQHDSSGDDEGGILANDNDRDAEMLLGEPVSYQLPDQPEPEVSHYEEPPAPKLEAQAGLTEIRDQMWNRAVHNIPIQEDASSEKAVEIHLDDGAKN